MVPPGAAAQTGSLLECQLENGLLVAVRDNVIGPSVDVVGTQGGKTSCPKSRGPLLLRSSALLGMRSSKVDFRQYFTTMTFGVPDPKRNDR